MVHLNTNDLAHILEQIRIAEEHSRLIAEGVDPGVALSQLVTSPLIPYGLRTVDGSFNNFQPGMERFGSSDEVMTRLLIRRQERSTIPSRASSRTLWRISR